jgi:hypothetical protein
MGHGNSKSSSTTTSTSSSTCIDKPYYYSDAKNVATNYTFTTVPTASNYTYTKNGVSETYKACKYSIPLTEPSILTEGNCNKTYLSNYTGSISTGPTKPSASEPGAPDSDFGRTPAKSYNSPAGIKDGDNNCTFYLNIENKKNYRYYDTH